MKTKFILPLIAIILVSSCSDKFSLQKRRYNKGFYFAKTHSRNTDEHPSTEMKRVKALPENQPSPEVEIVTANATDIQKTSSGELNMPAKTETKTKKNQSSAPVMVFAPKKFRDLVRETAVFNNPATSKDSDSDVKLILLVILAIFIPPLAVYLKDRSTNKWFWITFILCLLSLFTVFLFVFGGLLWLIAVVIALLYVLDLL